MGLGMVRVRVRCVVPGVVDVWGMVGGVHVRACSMRLEVVERGVVVNRSSSHQGSWGSYTLWSIFLFGSVCSFTSSSFSSFSLSSPLFLGLVFELSVLVSLDLSLVLCFPASFGSVVGVSVVVEFGWG